MSLLARLRGFDYLMLSNFVLWSGVILFGYRWRNLEFHIYLLLVLLQAIGLFTAWLLARRLQVPTWVLLLLQVAVLLHLAGGSIFVGQTRLYDLSLAPGVAVPLWFSQFFRFDKLVHGYFAAVGVWALRRLWPQLAGAEARGIHLLVILLAVMGICSVVEILEYMGTKIAYLPEVGGYDNNLQDLLANLVGALGGTLSTPWLHPNRSSLRRLGKPGWVLLGLLLLPVVAPLPPALLLTHPPTRPLWISPADGGLAYEDIRFPSRSDGTLLRGWYMAGASGDRAVVLVHGWVNDRLIHGRGLPLARALVQAGYDVLLFDLRGHGESPGTRVTLGAREQGDVAGALDFVRERGAQQVGVVGFSIGAVATLLVAPSEPAITAIVSDSAFTDLELFLTGLATERARLPQAYAKYALGVYQLVSGIAPGEVVPLDAVTKLVGRPVLFIHGTDDRLIAPTESEKLHAALRGSELWLVEGARHTHSYEADPARYTARILTFLEQHMVSSTGLGAVDGRPALHAALRG